jgi:hypothetical protein
MTFWDFADAHPVLTVVLALIALCAVGAVAEGLMRRTVVIVCKGKDEKR